MSEQRYVAAPHWEDRATGPQPTPVPLSHCFVLILASLAAGLFLVWILSVGWVLEILAGIILLANFAIGVAVACLVYRRILAESVPHWARLTVAIILGVAVALAVGEVTHSHKLIRDYKLYSSDYED